MLDPLTKYQITLAALKANIRTKLRTDGLALDTLNIGNYLINLIKISQFVATRIAMYILGLIVYLMLQIIRCHPVSAKEINKMTDPIRISVEEARQKASDGSALLVCAYDDDEKFKNNHLQGAISLKDFRAQLPSLSTEQQIIFYCG